MADRLQILYRLALLGGLDTKPPQLVPAQWIYSEHLSMAALLTQRTNWAIRWQCKRFIEHWTRLSRNGKPGRPATPKEVQELIRTMSAMNPTWGSPHILGELAKLGISASKSTVEKYMVRTKKPPSQTWRSFLENHAREIVSIDFIVAPTVRFTML